MKRNEDPHLRPMSTGEYMVFIVGGCWLIFVGLACLITWWLSVP